MILVLEKKMMKKISIRYDKKKGGNARRGERPTGGTPAGGSTGRVTLRPWSATARSATGDVGPPTCGPSHNTWQAHPTTDREMNRGDGRNEPGRFSEVGSSEESPVSLLRFMSSCAYKILV